MSISKGKGSKGTTWKEGESGLSGIKGCIVLEEVGKVNGAKL